MLLAKWILSYFPPHRIYVEPYGGAASVLMQKPRSYAEVYNDVWDEVVNLFRVLRDPESAPRLECQLKLTPFARVEFEEAYCLEVEPVERARKLLIRSFMGHGSASANAAHKTGFRNDSMRSGTTPYNDWKHWPDYITEMTERLQGVCIEHRPAAQIIEEFDGTETLFYVDPPYSLITRPSAKTRKNSCYAHEMTDTQHRELSEVLRKCAGMVILSGYPCALYDELYGDWGRAERIARADGAQKRTEVLWMNAAAIRGMAQGSLFDGDATI